MPATNNTEPLKQIHYLAAALKAPRITEAAARLADQARDAGWSFEDYLAAVLERKSPPATPPARNCASVPPDSAPARLSRISTSMPNRRSGNNSPCWPREVFSPRPATSCCSDHLLSTGVRRLSATSPTTCVDLAL
uniref:Uncharacterized protein n=1 Tax=Rhodococcus sp. NS1 TaxID=402236 RepID=A0A097SPX9_9NOCA|nr:hypothetical protein LRS1606.140 [Rhodococcus sp. NS1]